jgi:hypothetical protein
MSLSKRFAKAPEGTAVLFFIQIFDARVRRPLLDAGSVFTKTEIAGFPRPSRNHARGLPPKFPISVPGLPAKHFPVQP